ncbi:unnamed protein product [Gadus morhua 'NCC']
MITWKPSVLFPHHVNTLSVVADNNPTQGSTQRGSLFVPLVLSLAKAPPAVTNDDIPLPNDEVSLQPRRGSPGSVLTCVSFGARWRRLVLGGS